MDLIHETKGNQESGKGRLYSQTGELIWSGRMESLKGRGNYTWTKDKKAYSYNHNHPGHGLDTIDTYLNKAINLEVHDNNYILTVIKVFNAYDGSLFTNLKDGNMSTIYNYNDDFYTDANIKDKIKQVFDEKYNEIKDNIVEYKYTFIKEEDNYIFKKYEIIKN